MNRLCRDVEFMIGHRPGAYWRLCWGFITPVFMLIILIYFIITYKPLTYNGVAYPATYLGKFLHKLFSYFHICFEWKLSNATNKLFNLQLSAGQLLPSESCNCHYGPHTLWSKRRALRSAKKSPAHCGQPTIGAQRIQPHTNATGNMSVISKAAKHISIAA